MKMIKQFKNWLFNMMGHKNSPMITIFICIIIILTLISIGKSKHINILEKKIENQSNYIEELDQNILMPLGLEIDSLKAKLINQEYFIEQLWNNRQ